MQRAGHEDFATTLIYIREAETFGDVGASFPPLPPAALVKAADRGESSSFWGTFGSTGILPVNPAQEGENPLLATFYGDPSGNRTRVTGVRGRCPNR